MEIFKIAWSRLKLLDSKEAWTLIYSKKIKKRFVRLFSSGTTKALAFMIQILNETLLLEYVSTQSIC
jgi:hypothetical protein